MKARHIFLLSGAGGISPLLIEIAQNLIAISKGGTVTLEYNYLMLAILILFIIGGAVGLLFLNEEQPNTLKPKNVFLTGISAPALVMNAYLSTGQVNGSVSNWDFSLFNRAYAQTKGLPEAERVSSLAKINLKLSPAILASKQAGKLPPVYTIIGENGDSISGELSFAENQLTGGLAPKSLIVRWQGLETHTDLVDNKETASFQLNADLKEVMTKQEICRKGLFSKSCLPFEKESFVAESLTIVTATESQRD